MPIVAPSYLPAIDTLRGEDIFVLSADRASRQDIRPVRIVIVNLMPTKVETETQLIRMLSNTPLQVHVDLVHMSSHVSHNTSDEHLDRFYRTFSDIAEERYDGMIVTGAPVETLDFEDVDYWPELRQVLDYAATNVYSTIFLCWAAQAALYHYYRVPKRRLGAKLFGVFEHQVVGDSPLTRGFDRVFWAPQSRHTTVLSEDLAGVADVHVLATSERTGFHIAATGDGRFVFVSGHGEYDEHTLDSEYRRDVSRGLDTKVPENYFIDDDPAQSIRFSWRSHGTLMFTNWLNYFVYQSTPYDLEKLPRKVVAKFGGSSLADAQGMGAARGILEEDPQRQVVVVSAPGKRDSADTKVTDDLESLFATAHAKRDLEVQLIKLHKELASLAQQVVDATDRVQQRFDEICVQLGASETTRELCRRTLAEAAHHVDHDTVVSRGEYLTAHLMAEYLGCTMLDAADLIFFTADGDVDTRRTREAVQRLLAANGRVVVPGFYGRDADGTVKLFSRGGSDITGSILAAASDASRYENWTDVDGVMTANPRSDDTARTIEVLDYDELARIAESGAQVYHPGAIAALKERRIPLEIRNTRRPTSPYTRVVVRKEGDV